MSLGNFSLIKELGQGGMATVFLAEDKKFDTFVAIKILKKEFVANENIRKRFVAEAKNMYRMSHPNIIKVTDLVDEGDTVAFVMEYIEGETLKEYTDRKGKLNDEEVKAIFIQVLDAVGYVHDNELVHRDIKPSNFMVDKKGKVKLMDFGIAKNTNTSSSEYTQTGTGMQMGTPMYMSPEQVKSTKEVTAASDIYSLGVVLWQLVMAKKPYEGDTLSTFEIQLKIVQEALEKTHSNWDPIIEKATAKNEKDRYASCSAWLKELNQGLQESPPPSKNETTVIERFDATDKTVIEQDLTKDIMLEVSMLASDGTLKYGFVDVKGNWLIQPMFDAVGYFDKQGYCKATINTKEGFIDKNGNWKIQPIYDNLLEFDENGYAEAKINDKVGFIDRRGKWVIQPVFENLGRFSEKGYCTATLNGKVGIINKSGNWVIQPKFDHVGYADEQGYCEVELNGKFGFIDEKGQWIIHSRFDMMGVFDEEGYASVYMGEKRGFIDRKGNWIIQPLFDEVSGFDRMGYCKVTLNEKVGFIDRKGNWLVQPKFEVGGWYGVGFDEDGYCAVKLNEKVGIIDRKGNWIIQPIFDNLSVFDDKGYCIAKVNEKEGFIDRRGNWIIQPVFDELYFFDDSGVCSVKMNGKSGVIDRKGDWVLQTNFEINYFNPIGNHGFIVGVDSKFGFIDKNGNWIVQPTFIVDEIIHNQIIKVSENNKFGFVDVYGNWIIPPKFDYIYTDIWADEPFFWNEETKDWEFNNSSESGYSDIDDETIEGYFSHLVGKEKVFLSDNLPANKLKNFINQFNAGFFSEGNVVVYYDDTLWGKGDNGFLIYRCEFNRLYLFINDFAGEKLGFCFENDQVNPVLLSSTYLVKDKKLQLTYQDQEGEEKILEWINSNAATLALDTFIQENTGEQNMFDFSTSL
jgi:serine/threonine protein kinase